MKIIDRKWICLSMIFALDNVAYHNAILKLIIERIDKDNYTEQVIIQKYCLSNTNYIILIDGINLFDF